MDVKETRLIYANALVETIESAEATASDGSFSLSEIRGFIDNATTMDAAPVVHGRWEWLGPYRYNNEGMIGTCSVCKERLRLFARNYCPNCGAKMDGGAGNG